MPDEFVDDHTAGILTVQQRFGTGGGESAENEEGKQQHEAPGQREGKKDKGRQERRKKRTCRSGGLGGKPCRSETTEVKNDGIKGSHANSGMSRFASE